MRGFTMIETLMVVAIISLLVGGVILGTMHVREVNAQRQVQINVILRQVAIDQMYETHGITADEIWLQAAKSELLRRGLSGPSPLTRQSLAAYLDGLNLDPPFAVPDRYDARTLQALGLPEPEFR